MKRSTLLPAARMAVAFVLACATTSLFAQEAEPLRAWVAARGNQRALLVGVTHAHASVDSGPYDQEIVFPALQMANVALIEEYQKEDAENFGKALLDDCAKSLPLRWERIEPEWNAMRKEFGRHGIEVGIGSDLVNKSFFWINSHLNELSSRATRKLLYSADGEFPDERLEREASRISMSDKLLADIRAHRRPRRMELDGLEVQNAAYCRASLEEREAYMVDRLRTMRRELVVKEFAREHPSASLQRDPIVMSKLLGTVLACVDAAPPCTGDFVDSDTDVSADERFKGAPPSLNTPLRFLIVERNRLWMSTILQAISAHGRAFIEVGAVHLPALRYGDRIEHGLIDLLRQEGFTVRQVRTLSDIQNYFDTPGLSGASEDSAKNGLRSSTDAPTPRLSSATPGHTTHSSSAP